MRFVLGLAMAGALCGAATAEEPALSSSEPILEVAAAPPEPPAGEPGPQTGELPAGTPVFVQLAEPLTSKTARRGDSFAISLAEPIAAEAGVIVPVGALGVGEVISAARSKPVSGQAGELVLAARYIEYGGRRVALRGLKLTATGRDTTSRNNVCRVAFTLCVQGATDIELPAGVVAQAKLAEDVSLPVIAPPSAIAPPPSPTEVP